MELNTDDTMYKYLCSKIETLEARLKAIEDTEKEKLKPLKSSESKSVQSLCKNGWVDFYEKWKMLANAKGVKNNLKLGLREQKVHSSIILFGVSNSGGSNKEQMKLDDEKTTFQIFKEIGFDLKERKPCEQILIDRLEFNTENKLKVPPPIRVRLENTNTNRTDLGSKIKKAAKKLKNSTKFQDVIIGVDLSERQIAQFIRSINDRIEVKEKLNKDAFHRNFKLSETLVILIIFD
jgi:hypothetical protein